MLLIPRTYTLNGESALALYLAQSHTQVAHGVGGKRPPSLGQCLRCPEFAASPLLCPALL